MSSKPAFHEYLLVKGAISEDQLRSALISQARNTPGILTVVCEKSLLPMESVLKIMSDQGEHGRDFISSAKAQGCWTDELRHSVIEAVEGIRPSLVQLLLDSGALTVEAANMQLDAYFAELIEAPVKDPATAIETAPAQALAAVSVGVVEPDVIALSAGVEEYGNQFSELEKNTIMACLDAVVFENSRPALIETLRRLSGSARFAKLEVTCGVLQLLENCLAGGVIPGTPWDEQVLAAAKRTVEALWRLKAHIMSTGGEDGFYVADPQGQQMLELCRKALSGVTIVSTPNEVQDAQSPIHR